MRKSTIWLLAVVMAFAFAGLLFLQVKYVSIILKKSSEQFNETVKRSMHQVSKNLELDETARYLEEDLSRDEANNYLYQNEQSSLGGGIITEKKYKMQFTNADGTVEHIEFHSDIRTRKFEPLSSLGSNKVPNSIVSTSKDLQQTLKRRYQYQSGLFNEVILNILHTANLKPIEERIDFKKLNNYLKSEFVNNGLNLPFVFAVINKDGKIVYQNGDIPPVSDVIQQVLFPNDPPSKQNYLKVYFPTKGDYISSSVTFIVPSIIFSLILLVTFIFTIYIVFRQKRLSEMKNDFINNMTHELKTPVSTISLAAQMLKDSDITKSPDVFKHISGVINDETKRLGFLVEKVLQMSLFERQKAALKLKEVDANDLLASVANTFALKVEKKKKGAASSIREYGPLLLFFLLRPYRTVAVLFAPVNRITSPIYFKNGFRSKGDCCMDQVALGKRIKTARERAGMTQEDLAAAVDYSVDHMSVVERGVKAPKLDKLVTIANVLKVGTDELLQDNLDAATLLHATELSERLKTLSPEGQRKVMNVLDTLVDELR